MKQEQAKTENEIIETEITTELSPEIAPTLETDETVEQIGKDIAVGRKEVRYEDGLNVISVIINAISVRVNMPRGTVKALMAVLAALLLLAALVGFGYMSSNDSDTPAANDTEQATGDSAGSAEKSAQTPEGIVSLKDYVRISSHFYYHLPDNIYEVWQPEELYAQNETMCDFTEGDDLYTIRSYVLDWRDEDIADIVKADLMLFDDMKITGEEYIDGKYGEVLKISFETVDEEGAPLSGIGYYWYEAEPEICCLEVTTDLTADNKVDDEVAKRVLDSVYRVSSGDTAPYEVDESAVNDALKDEAMDSIAEDAARDSYDTKPDVSDRTLKP